MPSQDREPAAATAVSRGSGKVVIEFLARYGGEEFLLVLPDAEPSEALTCAEKLCAAARGVRLIASGEELAFSASAGVATGVGEAGPEILLRADEALYAAKEAGRDRAELSIAAPPVRSRVAGQVSVEERDQRVP